MRRFGRVAVIAAARLNAAPTEIRLDGAQEEENSKEEFLWTATKKGVEFSDAISSSCAAGLQELVMARSERPSCPVELEEEEEIFVVNVADVGFFSFQKATERCLRYHVGSARGSTTGIGRSGGAEASTHDAGMDQPGPRTLR